MLSKYAISNKTINEIACAKTIKILRNLKRQCGMAKKQQAKPAKVAVKTGKSTKPAAKGKAQPASKPKAKAASKAEPMKTSKPAVKASAKAEKPAKTVQADAAPQEISEKPNKAAKGEKPAKTPKVKVEKKSKAKLAAEKNQVDELKKWSDYKNKYGGEKAQAYSMSSTYEAGTPLMHKVLGWGFIIQVQNDRLEVLFETGSKVLISNYKP